MKFNIIHQQLKTNIYNPIKLNSNNFKKKGYLLNLIQFKIYIHRH